MDPKKFEVLKMTLTKDQIQSFVSGLHEIQEDMLEASVKIKERQGFPEATAVINHIMSIKGN